jgi:hypothetical protein
VSQQLRILRAVLVIECNKEGVILLAIDVCCVRGRWAVLEMKNDIVRKELIYSDVVAARHIFLRKAAK